MRNTQTQTQIITESAKIFAAHAYRQAKQTEERSKKESDNQTETQLLNEKEVAETAAKDIKDKNITIILQEQKVILEKSFNRTDLIFVSTMIAGSETPIIEGVLTKQEVAAYQEILQITVKTERKEAAPIVVDEDQLDRIKGLDLEGLSASAKKVLNPKTERTEKQNKALKQESDIKASRRIAGLDLDLGGLNRKLDDLKVGQSSRNHFSFSRTIAYTRTQVSYSAQFQMTTGYNAHFRDGFNNATEREEEQIQTVQPSIKA